MKKTLEYKKGVSCNYFVGTLAECEAFKTKLLKEGWVCKYVEK